MRSVFLIGLAIFAGFSAYAEIGSQESPLPAPSVKRFLISTGPGFTLLNGRSGASINLGGSIRPFAFIPVYVGLDLAATFWNLNSYESTTASQTAEFGAQLLPSAFYVFTISGSPSIHPFLGLSVGPHYTVRSNSASFEREALVRAGITFSLTPVDAVTLEPKFGLLANQFIFLPQVNFTFSL